MANSGVPGPTGGRMLVPCAPTVLLPLPHVVSASTLGEQLDNISMIRTDILHQGVEMLNAIHY